MPFDYYRRLSGERRAIYRASDAVARIDLPRPGELVPLAEALGPALRGDDRVQVEKLSAAIVRGMCRQLELRSPSTRVLAARPSASVIGYAGAELHGLYSWEVGQRPILMVWMRTAREERPVAHRTFVRTLMHEVGHHLDYHYLKLEESFHTQGFFRRESSLTKQILPRTPRASREHGLEGPEAGRALLARLRGEQLGLPIE